MGIRLPVRVNGVSDMLNKKGIRSDYGYFLPLPSRKQADSRIVVSIAPTRKKNQDSDSYNREVMVRGKCHKIVLEIP